MRILAIGDIHGCSQALDTVLTMVQPRPDDLLITLGDYVDRGPDSKGVMNRLLELNRTGRLVALRGNHDQMMRDARRGPDEKADWLVCGGRTTLASYSPRGDAGQLADVPDEHWKFLDQICLDWYETETHFFVHANAYADLPLAQQPDYMLFWEPLDNVLPWPHRSGKVMICGHTRQRSGQPLNLGHAICIDTWVYGPGWLTCLDVKSGQIWQGNQLGQQRTGCLDEKQ
jgi:serine/threonine protein phosphatase 1